MENSLAQSDRFGYGFLATVKNVVGNADPRKVDVESRHHFFVRRFFYVHAQALLYFGAFGRRLSSLPVTLPGLQPVIRAIFVCSRDGVTSIPTQGATS